MLTSSPERTEWVTAAGLRAFVMRHPTLRFFCAYVEVPDDHPFHGRNPDYVIVAGVARYEPLPLWAPGGITFAGPAAEWMQCRDDAQRVSWWVGFDCSNWEYSTLSADERHEHCESVAVELRKAARKASQAGEST